MNRFRELGRFPKILLIALLLMTVVFGAVYGITASRVGYLHNGEIFVPRQENGATLYEATVDGQDCVFTVTEDTVTLVWGSKTYGPYTVREDPTAVPDGHPQMTGIEILDGQKVYFRGGVTDEATDFWLLSEDGKRMAVVVAHQDMDNSDRMSAVIDVPGFRLIDSSVTGQGQVYERFGHRVRLGQYDMAVLLFEMI